MSVPRRLEARAYLEQARDMAERLGDEDLALAALETLGQLSGEEGDDAEAERLYRRTLERADPDSKVAVRACLGFATLLLRRDEPQAALDQLERAQRGAVRAQDRILLGRVLNNLGLVHHARRDYEAALHCFGQALRVREGIGYRWGTIVNHHNIGETWLHLGDLAQAHAAFSESLRLARELEWLPGITMNALYLGYLDAQRGDERGGARLDEALQRARASRDWALVADGLGLRARLALARGDRTAADQAWGEAIACAQRAGDIGQERELSSERAAALG
jgi:tetratricopeptide (TPR) repeat protein